MKRGRFTTANLETIPFKYYFKLPKVIWLAILRKYLNIYPELPWIPFSAINALNTLIKPDWKILEIGAGMSTIWLSKRSANIISIEADKKWFDELNKKIESARINNIDLRYEWRGEKMANFDEFPDHYFDLIYIDGGPRELCCKNALKKIKPNGYIYLDNSDSLKTSGKGSEVLKNYVKHNSKNIFKLIDFVPGNFMINEGLLIKIEN